MIRLFAFYGGSEVWDKSILTMHRDLGKTITIPFQYFLVDHPKGKLLFDTGAHPDVVLHPDRVRRVRPWASNVAEADLAPNRLAEVGVRPEEIKFVANSHLHYDHAGGNVFFPKATFLVQFDELRGAMWPEPWLRRNYHRPDFDLPVSFEELDGDFDVFADGKVVLVKTAGHTAGSQSLVVTLEESGTIVLGQDAFYLHENLDELILPTNVWDPKEMMRSYRRLKDLRRRHNALLIPGHDIVAWQALKHAPEWYQ